MSRLREKGDLRTKSNQLSDLITWLAVGVILGGRLGWWLLYNRPDGASERWYDAFALWNGGMSFHGGLAGVALATFFWCRRTGLSFWNVADSAALVAPVGLFFGRIANFINAELDGRPTTAAWGMLFPGEQVARHPSQLYEAIL